MFTITRIYSDANGESHFEDIQIPLEDAGDIGFLSATKEALGVIFREVKPGYDYHFHNAPRRQYIVLLDGGIEIETSLGEKKFSKQEKYYLRKTQEKDTGAIILRTGKENLILFLYKFIPTRQSLLY